MSRFLALTRRETEAILLSPAILFASAFFVLLNSFAFFLTTVNSATAYAVFDEMAMFMLFTSIVIYPIVSMHTFSEENASGTLETLLTAPVGHLAVVLAKYLATMIFVSIYLLHGLVFALLLAYGGNLDWNSTLAALLALFAVGSLAMSLGVFVSAITVSPAAAAAGTGGVLIFLALTADIDPYAGNVADILSSLSFIPHARRWIAGELDTRGLIYFVSATALFLFYAWMSAGVRGTGKAAANATVRRRMTVTYFLILGGVILLITQVALLHIRGFWESGMPVGPGLIRVPRLLLLPLLLSLMAFGWSLLTFRAAKRAERDCRATRKLRYATISETRVLGAPRLYYEEDIKSRRRIVLAALAALAIVVNLNWLAHYPFRTFADTGLAFLTHLQDRRWDVSEDARNTLSAGTRRTLDALQGRVQTYSFLSENADARGVPIAEEMRRLLGRYSDYNSLVVPTFADAVREPELAGELAKEIGVDSDNLETLLIVDHQGRRMAIPAGGLVAPPDWRAQMAGENRWVFDGENRLTQTIMRLADPRVPNVFFLHGHLEHSLVAGPYADRSAARLARALSAANMRVRQHIMTPTRPIPPECDVLVIASPRVPYQEYEIGEIRRYLDSGGRLLLVAPAPGEEYAVEGDALNEFAFSLGGGFRDDVIRDAANNDNGQTMALLGRAKSAGEGSAAFVFPASRSIRDNPRSPEEGWLCERMIESYPSATAVSPADGSQRAGPFTLLYRSAKTTDSGEARVVTVASSRMAADSDITRGANEALLLGMVQWLAGREESRDIEPRAWIDRRLRLTGQQMRAILWIGVVALPLAWLMAGITVWWTRRE